MATTFEQVKEWLLDLDLNITSENEAEELVVVSSPDEGIQNMIIDCESPLIVIEQMIMPVPDDDNGLYKALLQMNRTLVHGAFVLNEDGTYIFYRDTLQLDTLDPNELEASIQSLSMALGEYSTVLLEFAKR